MYSLICCSQATYTGLSRSCIADNLLNILMYNTAPQFTSCAFTPPESVHSDPCI